MTNRRAVLAFGILGGIALAALAVVGPFGGVLARAESAPLALDIYTADSQGLGVTSTLIYGDQEAILVDTQFRIADAEKLAERIAAKGRKPQGHSHHASALRSLLWRLRAAQALSRHARLRERLRHRVHQGQPGQHRGPDPRPLRAEAIPTDILIPQPWPGTHFTVDGQAVDVIAGLQGDVGPGPRNNVVWVPSLAAAIVGDIAFNQVHLSLRATDADSRKAWQETLRLVQERNPRIVVAGHKNHPELPDTPDVLAFNRAYLTEFEAALAASHNAGELVAAMKQKFPQAGLDRILNFTAARFFPS